MSKKHIISVVTRFLLTMAIMIGSAYTVTQASAATVVACVGDSITAGFTLQNPRVQSYPAHLQNILGGNYQVLNFGHTSATLLTKGNVPYIQTQEYADSLKSDPNIVIIMLGTNDSKPFIWSVLSKEFPKDYVSLIKTYQSLPTHPVVYICLIPPYCKVNPWTQDFPDPNRIPKLLLPSIKEVHKLANVKIIDNYKPFVKHPELYTDGIHPTEKGAMIIAENVSKAVKSTKSTARYK